MDFNAPSFEGFVPFKSHVSPVEANRGRARTNFLEILKEMATEATTTNVSSEGTPTLVRELENQQTFQDLLPPSMWAMPNLGYKKTTSEKNIVEGVETIFSLEGTPNVGRETESRQTLHNLLPLPLRGSPNAGHEQEGQRGFNHFYMLNPLYRANQQHQQIFDLPSSSRELEVAPFLNKHGELEQRIISSQDFTTYQPPSSSTKRLIGDDGSEKKLKLNEAEDIGTRRILSPSQLIELQDQTLIYNYISANMVVPPQHLLYNNSLCSHCFSASCNGFSPSSPTRKGSVRPSHAGKSGDPEPGRCRRSDGKKWRCSKEVVADEKYCEKHRNRGRIRQRSRKTTRGRKVAAGDSGMVVPGTSSGVVPVRVESGVSLGCLVNKQEAELKNLKPEFANSSVAALFNW